MQAVILTNPLTIITWPYRGLSFRGHQGHVFFEIDRWPSAGLCLDRGLMSGYLVEKQCRIVRKPVNANPGFKVNQNRAITRLLEGILFICGPSSIIYSNYATYKYCTVLYCTVLYWQCSSVSTVLYCAVLCCTVLYCTVLYCTVLYCTVLYCTVLYCAVLCCTVPYCAVLCCTVLYCAVLCCTVLYCAVLAVLFCP